MKIHYKDIDGKSHYTNGKPVGIQVGGFLNCKHLVVERKASTLYIPEYLVQDAALINQYKTNLEGLK